MDALPEPGILSVPVVGAVGLPDIDFGDSVAFFIGVLVVLGGHQQAVVQRHGDQPLGGDHIVLVRRVDLAHGDDVGVDGHLVGGQLHRHIVVGGDNQEIPNLFGIADQDGVIVAVVVPCAVLVQNGGQHLHAVPGGLGLLEDHPGDGQLTDPILRGRVELVQLRVVNGGHSGGNRHPQLVDTRLGIGRNDYVPLAVHNILPVLQGVPDIGVPVGVGGIGHGEAGGILIDLALLMVGGLDDLKDLGVVLADILAPAKEG